VIVGMGKQ